MEKFTIYMVVIALVQIISVIANHLIQGSNLR